MSQEAILVTGAAGGVGSTAHTAIATLLEQGHRVRAMVRNLDARADTLRDMGAEVMVADMLDIIAVRAAMQGCSVVYFTMSVSPNYLEAAANVAVTAQSLGVKAFVNLSQMTLSQMSEIETTSSPQQKQHWLAEQMLRWSGLPVVYLRPTACKVYELTGPQSLTMAQFAQEFSGALGRTIQYVNVPPQIWEAKLQEAQLPAHSIAHLITMAQLHRDNRYDRMTDPSSSWSAVRRLPPPNSHAATRRRSRHRSQAKPRLITGSDPMPRFHGRLAVWGSMFRSVIHPFPVFDRVLRESLDEFAAKVAREKQRRC